MSEQYTRTKTVIVSPKWALISADVLDLGKDFIVMAGTTLLLMIGDHVTKIDFISTFGPDNGPIAVAAASLIAAIASRLARKLAKESNYPHPNE